MSKYFRIDSKKVILLFFLSISFSVFSNNFTRLDAVALANTKAKILNGTASYKTLFAYYELIKQADKLLKSKNVSVTDKTILPPSKDKHDYISISRYWWPNLDKEEGLPWVRKDGETNPDTQTDAVDRKRLGFMGSSVWNLSLAYYFTDKEKYAKKAISMMRTWFINPKTLMNPHLEYGQSVPGNPEKRRSGILDGRSIARFIPDAILLVSTSKNFKKNDKTKMNNWLSDYLLWLTKSDLGIKGSFQENNHGSWYRYQVATLAFYLNDKELVKKTVEITQESLHKMLDNNGGQTHELARSRSYFYSCFNLQALIGIAELGDKVGMNMWTYKSKDQKSLSLAIDYLTPAVFGEKWRHDTLKKLDFTGLIPIISKASKHIHTKEYAHVLSKIINNVEGNKPNDNLLESWLLGY